MVAKDMTDFIKRDRNHPSIIMWSIGNEVTGATPEIQHNLVSLFHQLDPDRPVTQGGTDPTRGMKTDYQKFNYLDIIGFNGNGEEIGELEHFHKTTQHFVPLLQRYRTLIKPVAYTEARHNGEDGISPLLGKRKHKLGTI